MVFNKFILVLFYKIVIPVLVFLITSCQEIPVSSQDDGFRDSIGLSSALKFDLSSNAFQLSDTKESQLAVFDSFFSSSDGYKLPGNPSKIKLHAFFDELRNGYFMKDEGIDYSHIRKEYHTFTHAMDVMITTHALLESGGAVYLSSAERASLVLAALGHDVLHTGVNNSF